MMRLALIAVLIVLFHTPCRAEPAQVTLIGSFSSLKWTTDEDPHLIDGYSVSLFQSEKTLFGRMVAANGSSEPSQGNLYDIRFDPATGRLQFKCKMSFGWESGPGIPRGGRASRDLLEFSGRIKRGRLAGTMVIKDGYAPDNAATSRKVSMKQDKDNYTPKSFEEWLTHNPAGIDW